MTPAEILHVKELLPTELGSDEVREQIARDILARSVFSARMASVPYLARVREVCEQLAAGEISQADARNTLEGVLEMMGHKMGDAGGLRNPASIRRLNLIVSTQTQMAASVSRLVGQTEATVHANPAWELTRLETRAMPRTDWRRRWREAGDSVGWEGACQGRMVALKSSPIWQALGDGVGGFKDALGNPYPPFAYSSGLSWVAVPRDECVRLGLDPDGAERDEGGEVPTLSPGERDIADAIERYGMPEIWEDIA